MSYVIGTNNDQGTVYLETLDAEPSSFHTNYTPIWTDIDGAFKFRSESAAIAQMDRYYATQGKHAEPVYIWEYPDA